MTRAIILLIFVYSGLLVCVDAQTKPEFECVRSTPTPVLRKGVFPKRTFTLTKNTENPAEKIGYEKTVLSKGANLTIINGGCESYVLTFRFELAGISHKTNDARFWYGKAVELMRTVKKGIRAADLSLINRGTRAVALRLEKKGKPDFDESINFGGKEIKDEVVVRRVERQSGGRYRLEISYSVGPL